MKSPNTTKGKPDAGGQWQDDDRDESLGSVYESGDTGSDRSSPHARKSAGQGDASADGSLTIKRNKKFDIAARIGCVLVAFVIWVYVMANDSPTAERTFESIPVQITGQGDYALISDIGNVSVTIRGRRGQINQLDKSAIQAYVDISNVRSPGLQKVTVDVSVPSGTTLQSIAPASQLLYFGNTTTVSVPVDVHIAEYILPEGYVLDQPVCKPSEISVTGPEDVLARIKSARATIILGQVSGSVTSKAPLVLVDEDGSPVSSNYIKMQVNEATVDIPVSREIELPLTISYKYGYYNEGNVQITCSPQTILVRGEASAIENARWNYTIDEKSITGDGQFTIPITLSEGLTNVHDVKEATLTIKHIGTSTKQITITDFAVINPDNLDYTLLTNELHVTLRGTPTNLAFLSDKNVTATIDLSSFKNPSGSVMAPVTISVPQGLAHSVYEIGPYSMVVKLG